MKIDVADAQELYPILSDVALLCKYLEPDTKMNWLDVSDEVLEEICSFVDWLNA